MVTFSVTDGLRIFIDGVQIAAEPSDLRPLDNAYHAGEYTLLRSPDGEIGMMGILSTCLGTDDKAAERSAIFSFLMAKYGIT